MSTTRKKLSLKGILGWTGAGLFVLLAGLGAGRGQHKGFQVDADAGQVSTPNVTPATKRMAQELKKSVRKVRFRVRWQEVPKVGAKPVACAIHYDRDFQTLDYFRDQKWTDGYNDVTDTQLVILADKNLPLERLVRLGAKRTPQPKQK